MALVSIAVVGKENEPLYLRQYPTPDPLGDLDVDARAAEAEDDEDYFGFFSEENRRDECSLRHQVKSIAWLFCNVSGQVLPELNYDILQSFFLG